MAAELIVMLGGFLVVGLLVGFAFGVAWERRRADGVVEGHVETVCTKDADDQKS